MNPERGLGYLHNCVLDTLDPEDDPVDFIKLFLRHGASLKDRYCGLTCLHLVLLSAPRIHSNGISKVKESLVMLINAGADIHAKDGYGCTPSDYARNIMERRHKYLYRQGIEWTDSDDANLLQIWMEALEECGYDSETVVWGENRTEQLPDEFESLSPDLTGEPTEDNDFDVCQGDDGSEPLRPVDLDISCTNTAEYPVNQADRLGCFMGSRTLFDERSTYHDSRASTSADRPYYPSWNDSAFSSFGYTTRDESSSSPIGVDNKAPLNLVSQSVIQPVPGESEYFDFNVTTTGRSNDTTIPGYSICEEAQQNASDISSWPYNDYHSISGNENLYSYSKGDYQRSQTPFDLMEVDDGINVWKE